MSWEQSPISFLRSGRHLVQARRPRGHDASRPRNRGLPAWLLSAVLHATVVIVLCRVVSAAADDIVVYRTGHDGRDQSRVTGTIIDYNGQQLRILQTTGREAVIPTDRVVQVQSAWTPQHENGDRLLAAKRFAEALEEYRVAAGIERRPWVQRSIAAQQVWCYRALANPEQACVSFLGLYAADPSTQYFDAIPLGWTAHQPTLTFQRSAQSWLADGSSPVMNLIGASWLLAAGDRAQAMDVLKKLTNHADPRIAHLAEAQLWRTQIVTARTADVERWERQVERMPKSLRAGPSYLLGQALSRLEQHEQAAIRFMRIPIFYPRDRDLSASALHAAGQELERLSRSTEAVGLYREIVTDYADIPVAAEAQRRLDILSHDVQSQ